MKIENDFRNLIDFAYNTSEIDIIPILLNVKEFMLRNFEKLMDIGLSYSKIEVSNSWTFYVKFEYKDDNTLHDVVIRISSHDVDTYPTSIIFNFIYIHLDDFINYELSNFDIGIIKERLSVIIKQNKDALL